MLRDQQELLRVIRRPATLRLLNQLQNYHEVREFSKLFHDPENLVNWHQAEFAKLIDLLKVWMQQPVRVNFDLLEPIPQSEKNFHAPRSSPVSGRSAGASTTERERRRARRERRKAAREAAAKAQS